MNEDWIAQNKTRLFLHLSNGGLQRCLIALDGTCDEIVAIRVVTGHDYARTKLVPEHDFIAAWIMPQHGDRIATLHHFPRDSLDSSAVFLDVEFVLVYPQKSLVQGSSAVDDCSKLSLCHLLNLATSNVRLPPVWGDGRLERPDRVKENLGAAEVSLSAEDMAAIEARLAGIQVTGERLPPRHPQTDVPLISFFVWLAIGSS
jgi:hypothetical protein